LEIRALPLTLVPDVNITGERPRKAESCLLFSKVLKPLLQTMSIIAVFLPIPGMDKRFDNNCCSCSLIVSSRACSSSLISAAICQI
jgi:hypothetical protein